MRILRTAAGLILGYAVMVVLITLVQESWFGGVGWHESSLGTLAVAGFFTFLSAVAGAAIGTAIAGPTRLVAIVMCVLVVAETTTLTIQGRLGGPLWFDLLAAGSLLIGITVGAAIVLRRRPGAVAAPV